ncbi:MAG: 16S rRNA (cytosine(1402)-N(4))-methyltransferase RsmH [Gemmatimonadota bacterium]|nr:16S rRNA (cytosine(1402)-N(4))-methyltransferase RsmH [Gemmatimonadota bacterium]
MCGAAEFHTPVMGPETAVRVVNDPNGVYIDGTVGGGGHAEHMLRQMGRCGRLIGIDRDPEAVRAAASRLRSFSDRFEIYESSFRELPEILERMSVRRISGALFDLGVSSRQIDTASRGFSYLQTGPLDMRMGPDAPRSAKEVVNTYSLEKLTRIFREFGEERAAGRIARAICRRRVREPMKDTFQLAALISEITPGPRTTKTLARIFQAIRIEVNGELDQLQETLEYTIARLKTGGRIGVLSYHSLEDRTVKKVFRTASQGCICPPDLPVCGCGRVPQVRILTPRGIRPEAAERERNPRSRSATLRVAERIEERV